MKRGTGLSYRGHSEVHVPDRKSRLRFYDTMKSIAALMYLFFRFGLGKGGVKKKVDRSHNHIERGLFACMAAV
jgi:hypothetical protein